VGNGRALAQSNAIVRHLARGSALIPDEVEPRIVECGNLALDRLELGLKGRRWLATGSASPTSRCCPTRASRAKAALILHLDPR
jgi:hypothetical protein